MTFSIVGRCRRSGMLGVAITTSSISVGARCPHARAGVGAVASQNITDPTLGPAVLDHMQAGLDARHALDAALQSRPREEREYRQVTAIDQHGNAACHSGQHMLGVHATATAEDCVAAGNLLAERAVIPAIIHGFTANTDAHLAERLLTAIESGLTAGGEEGEVHSAALLVTHRHPFPLVDLRIDWLDHNPAAALRELWRAYEPQMEDYLTRAIDPTKAPAYGVPGDL